MTRTRWKRMAGMTSLGAATGAVLILGIAACTISSGPAKMTATSGPSSTSGAGSTPATSTALQTGSHEHSLVVAGTKRTYRTYVPANLDSSKPTSLVVMLHGGFGSSKQAEDSYGWDQMADRNGFIVAYPNGEGRAWNAGTCCGAPSRTNVDDVGFITDMVKTIRARADIDPRRIFVAGMSNGAMMAQRLACETNVFAAFASVSGAQMVPCDHAAPISALHIHGSADQNVPMDGSPGNGRGKVPAHPPIADSIAGWRTVDSCAAPTVHTSGTVTTDTASCAKGRTVTLITIAGAGHQWPGATKSRPAIRKLLGMDTPSTAIDATAVIWSFFAAHPQPA